MIMHKNAKGFTFVELIVATVILGIAVAGVYAAFLSSAKFTGAFRHEIMAAIGADGWLSKKLAENKYSDLGNTAFTDIPTADLHFFWNQLENEVDTTNYLNDTNPPEYEISTENLGCSNTDYDLKKITITVKWDERAI